ncbi:MAG: amidase [Chthonomonadales bacterium]|nr:amidase [Chthonomonadales bacterium]
MDRGDSPTGGRVGRRAALRAAAAACVVTLASEPTTAQDADAITEADLGAALRVTDRAYSEAERALMLPSVREMRRAMRQVRMAAIPQGAEPAIRFDPWVPGVPLPSGRSAFRPTKPVAPADAIDPDSLAFQPVSVLSAMLRARRVTSVELTQMYLQRLRMFDPQLLCVVTLTEELAMRQAEQADREIAAGRWRGPLHGVPWGAKDLLFTKGIRTTFGAKPYEDQIPPTDATVVQRLERAGAVLVAKLSLGELAMGDVWFRGMTRCPWDLTQGSSGSSAGPGAATAAGLVGFSIGTETLGSIVSPCVRNGTTGLRPTYGRVPRTGAMALSWTMDKIGPITRSVEDCALVLHAIAGPDGADMTVRPVPFSWEPAKGLAGLKIGLDEAGFAAQKDEAARAVYDRALDVLRKAGAELKPIRLPSMAGAYAELTNVIDVEGAASFASLIAQGKLADLAQQGPNNWPNIFRVGTTVAGVDYIAMMQLRAQLQREMAAAMADFDCYVTPPYATLVLTNLTGHPTLITRAGMDGRKPIMIEFTGQLYREDAILRVGHVFERAMGTPGGWPKLG